MLRSELLSNASCRMPGMTMSRPGRPKGRAISASACTNTPVNSALPLGTPPRTPPGAVESVPTWLSSYQSPKGQDCIDWAEQEAGRIAQADTAGLDLAQRCARDSCIKLVHAGFGLINGQSCINQIRGWIKAQSAAPELAGNVLVDIPVQGCIARSRRALPVIGLDGDVVELLPGHFARQRLREPVAELDEGGCDLVLGRKIGAGAELDVA